MEEAISLGIAYKADSIEELAEKIGVPADTLTATVARYNELCAAGVDEDFGKDAQYLDAIEKVGAENPSFRSMLPKMRYAGIEDGVVTVEFGRDGIMVRRVLESKAPLIEAALSEAFGQSMRLRTRNAGEQSAKTSAAAKSVIEQSYDVFGRDKIELTD